MLLPTSNPKAEINAVDFLASLTEEEEIMGAWGPLGEGAGGEISIPPHLPSPISPSHEPQGFSCCGAGGSATTMLPRRR